MFKFFMYPFFILVAVTVASPGASARDDCRDILAGLISQRTTLQEDSFERDYINWLNSNEFNSSQSASTASGGIGLSLPIEGIPIDFSGKFERGDYGSQSFSQSLASYLREHTIERHKFFEKLREANAKVVEAWAECQKLRAEALGMFCSIAQGANPDEFEVNVAYRPLPGDNSIITLKRLVYEKDTVKPIEDYKNMEIKANSVLTFKRIGGSNKAQKGGRIKIFTNNTRYDCASGDGLKFLPIVKEPKTAPFCKVLVKGKCVRCEFLITGSGIAQGTRLTRKCLGMPKGESIKVSFSGTVNVKRIREGSGCWAITNLLNSDKSAGMLNLSDPSCSFPVSSELDNVASQSIEGGTGGLEVFMCQWGAEPSTCGIDGKLVITTPQGQ
jgi:hypothetical protein